ncbi:MAG: DNA oxidative demethylase AlkB [Rhodocyclaceae bacterium]|nr:DNA oxidative demethylase AlkB [Rhodocyclaceae bacterium]MBX3668863.1 DNA oxidative demethylase AlkB [Rhodocyclaceae bacterium]
MTTPRQLAGPALPAAHPDNPCAQPAWGGSTPDLFADLEAAAAEPFFFAPGAALLRGFALPYVTELLAALDEICALAPFRHMQTPGGHTMSAAMSNCGPLGWVSDLSGYRYASADPQTGRPWPELPAAMTRLAGEAATAAGYTKFAPDACLINRYLPGAHLSLHQDRNERDFKQPIVSLSLGLPANFLWGGQRRKDAVCKLALQHGDIVVWGGASRLNYHGVAALAPGQHALLGGCRINLTLRKAG